MHDAEIHGARVVLVPLVAGDADELAGLLDDAIVRRFPGVAELAGLPRRFAPGGARAPPPGRRFASWETRRAPHGGQAWLNWVVRARDDGRALGWVQATVEGAAASVAYSLLPAEGGRD